MNGILALLLVCTGQSGFQGDDATIKNEKTYIAVPYQGRQFILYQGEGYVTTKVGTNVYKFDNGNDNDLRIVGSYDFATGRMVVDKFYNFTEGGSPPSWRRWAFMGFCSDPSAGKK